VVQYRNVGFTEAKGEVDMLLTASHRWNRFGLFGNVAYGQGLDANERDGELRAAALYEIHERVQVGLDARARVDLGSETPARAKNNQEAEFDLLAGPLASVAAGPFLILAQGGVHTLVIHEQPRSGVAVMAGVGLSF